MRKSISFQYFTLTLSLIIASIILTSAFIIYISIQTYKSHRHDYMADCAELAISVLSDALSQAGSDTEYSSAVTYPLPTSFDMGVYLFDSNGGLLSFTDNANLILSGDESLSKSVMVLSRPNGYFSESTLGGFFNGQVINLLYNFKVADRTYYLAVCMSTSEMNRYLIRTVASSLLLFLVLIVLVCLVLRYVIGKMMRPVKVMTMAAKRFGEGDFSEKINVSDNSELGYLANSMNEMAYSLEAIEENRKSFISNVSHELKTPMTTIGGFVDGILDGTIPDNMHRHYLKTVSEEVNRLARLVRSMLNISKYESGEMELQTEVFNITDLAAKTVLFFEKRINDKKVDVLGLDADAFFVNADCDLIQQVIYNLTENAVKFVNEGGFISFDFKPSDDGSLHVHIRNSGEGLKKNEMNKVFDRFYKTDESRGKDKTGVGLGLSIVRSIIKLHEGTIFVKSKEGEYTEFEFTIKSAPPPSRH